ncbi:Acg family FMN-binding oxidoreductase [Candidatus Rhodobacter oscarellae]|uniref:Acg family FMN-binding oxidoreductase n=1 Tax=Candidatus Rhodobacter oscarellae TaxID=1675527 RepID=UPI001F3562F9|nr:twin-arginine translocation pathway signal protein [Candidatus Rhodobacter lobularis]
MATRTPTEALAPWDAAGAAQYDDPRLHALSYAVLAPNPHNRQPWKVKLRGAEAFELYFDTDRQLPHTDPFDRQLTIGLGCFLELMEMAANSVGFAVATELFPAGHDPAALDRRPVAHVTFSGAATSADPLFAYALQRRSTKQPYDTTRPVPRDVLQRAMSAVRIAQAGGSTEAELTQYLRDLTEQALLIEIETPHTYKESVDLFRIGKAEVNANPDGISFSGPMFESLRLAGVLSRETVTDPSSVAYRGGIDAVTTNCRTSMGHIWLVTETNTRLDQIAVGRDWLRLNLATTREGLGLHPMSQALQEYPEMAALYADAHRRLAPDGGTVQMLGRIGYGPTVPASPRWPIEAKLVSD